MTDREELSEGPGSNEKVSQRNSSARHETSSSIHPEQLRHSTCTMTYLASLNSALKHLYLLVGRFCVGIYPTWTVGQARRWKLSHRELDVDHPATQATFYRHGHALELPNMVIRASAFWGSCVSTCTMTIALRS